MKIRVLSERDIFSVGSANRDNFLWEEDLMLGQKSMHLAKKAVIPLFPMRLPLFRPGYPFTSASLCGKQEGRMKWVSPGPFWLRRLRLARATSMRFEPPRKRRMIEFIEEFHRFPKEETAARIRLRLSRGRENA
jgi:hypothetical protein